MLELTKTVLKKVSFDKKLFKKELRKSIRWLKKDELILLKTWCLTSFAVTYHEIIIETFEAIGLN